MGGGGGGGGEGGVEAGKTIFKGVGWVDEVV